MTVGPNKLTSKERLERLREKTRESLPESNTVQFRIDKETLIALVKAADKKKMPLGTLVRMWTVERLAAEGFIE